MKSNRKFLVLILALVMCCSVIFSACSSKKDPEITGETTTEASATDENALKKAKYNEALALIEDKKYEDAYKLLKELGDYQDAIDALKHFRFVPTQAKIEVVYGDMLISQTIAISYDENNFLKQAAYKESMGAQGESEYTVAYTYNEKARVTKTVRTESDGTMIVTDYTYDEKDNLIKSVYSNPANGRSTTNEYVYNDQGKIAKETTTYVHEQEGGEPYTSTTVTDYIYDEKGNLHKEVDPYQIYEYTYDENGNMTKVVVSDAEDGSIYSTNVITYDENGKMVKAIGTDSDGKTATTTYSYDENGNLVYGLSDPYAGIEGAKGEHKFEYKLVYYPFDLSDEAFAAMMENFTLV